ncbi:MAG: carbamoyl-phosphate synthase large subunit [Deltaproteobacteria bacterium]|nr:carbamoyl-phosphate synthase large subunit [Deltaproteobacteria bacterium]
MSDAQRPLTILVIGSGPIVIGQACEFDYSGTQACRALKQDGARVVLVNSNPATIMTDPSVADRTYIEPLTVDALTDIIAAERPHHVLPTVGGQTGLNLGLALHKAGVLARFGCTLIGASVEAIEIAEDRQRFAAAMAEIGLQTPRSVVVTAEDQIPHALATVGVPAIVRPSFTLGGSGGGLADNAEQFALAVVKGLQASPTRQVLVEASIAGWKEFELEVMRDRADNVVIVCSIENLDPMGVHTGDSITVAPAQTLTDREYQAMRDAALRIIRKVGVETGGSNIQFAVDPQTGSLCVIEMNPRVSRSSALASKATGFPIAKIAARLALGATLPEVANDITRTTPACFEPALDYVVVKIPRFDFAKFPGAAHALGPQMKSVGEVMALGRTFREAFRKALASLEVHLPTVDAPVREADWHDPTPRRVLAVLAAVREGIDLQTLHDRTRIDPWFLHQFAHMAASERAVRRWRERSPAPVDWLAAKREGLTDHEIAQLAGGSEAEMRARRLALGVRATFARVDTCAGEFESHTPYLYSGYESLCEAAPTARDKVLILGSGPNRIGQGIEFDYCCCHAVYALRAAGIETVLINCNPETVSTDYDTADRLYFEPLTLEHVLEVARAEAGAGRVLGAIVQLGGQTPLRLAHGLQDAAVTILGTPVDAIDLAEDRGRFAALLRSLDICQPRAATAATLDEALAAAWAIGYPVLLRPSYVLGGQAMRVVYGDDELQQHMAALTAMGLRGAVLIDEFLEDAFEYDVDALCDGEHVVVVGVLEQVEEAGIHSGDSTAVLPPLKVKPGLEDQMRAVTRRLGLALGVRGLMNVQFAERGGVLYVLEVNPRASRTVPFLAKALHLPLVQWATHVMMGETLASLGVTEDPLPARWYVKAPVFPFKKFPGVDVLLGPEMRSTGEVMGVGDTPGEAFWKALQGAELRLPATGTVFLSVNDADKPGLVEIARQLHRLGYALAGTRGTALYLFDRGLPCQLTFKVGEGKPDVADRLRAGEVRLVVNTPLGRASFYDDKAIRLAAMEAGVPVITTLSAAEAAVQALHSVRAGACHRFAVQDTRPWQPGDLGARGQAAWQA